MGSNSDKLASIGARAAKKLNYTQATYLDKGENGVAMLVDANTVMKITTDGTEYTEASKIKGHRTEHMADIHGIWSISNPEFRGVYVIVKEKVDVDPSSVSKIKNGSEELNSVWEGLSLDIETNEETPSSFIAAYWNGRNRTMTEHVLEILRRDTKAHWYLLQVLKLIDELHHYDIKSKDFEDNLNIGLKNGNIAYFDMGYGQPAHVEMNYLELEGKNRVRKAVRQALSGEDLTGETFVSGL